MTDPRSDSNEEGYSYEVLDRFNTFVFCVYWNGDVRGSINIPKDKEHHIEIWKQAMKTVNALSKKE